jgi:hypothetical protein
MLNCAHSSIICPSIDLLQQVGLDITTHVHMHGDPVLVTLCSVFLSLCVPSVSTGNLATSPVPGTVSHVHMQ